MCKYLRMIAKISRWDGSEQINRKDALFTGDMLADLRTTHNKLSVWKADTNEDINDAIVALALNRDNLSGLSYIILDEKDLLQLGIEVLDDEKGDVKCLGDDILAKHRNMLDLDYWRLGFLAEYMKNLACDDNKRNTKTKSEIKTLLTCYKNRINMDEMKPKIKDELKW